MKKNYIMPSLRAIKCEDEALMSVSSDKRVSSDKGIDYGGVDEDGEREAESRCGRWIMED